MDLSLTRPVSVGHQFKAFCKESKLVLFAKLCRINQPNKQNQLREDYLDIRMHVYDNYILKQNLMQMRSDTSIKKGNWKAHGGNIKADAVLYRKAILIL